jgi:uncharacterized glyoxalase superfamily protein PhnB
MPARTDRESVRADSVTYVLGMNCHPCDRNRPAQVVRPQCQPAGTKSFSGSDESKSFVARVAALRLSAVRAHSDIWLMSSGRSRACPRSALSLRRDRPQTTCVSTKAPEEPSRFLQDAGNRPGPDGKAAHAILQFGAAMLMLEDEWPTLPSRAPIADGSSPVVIYVYVADVDATVGRALARGATLVVPVETQFWGHRTGWVRDPAGHMWTIATRVEDTSEDQRSERWSHLLEKPD